MSRAEQLRAEAFASAAEREHRFAQARKLSGTVVTPLAGSRSAAQPTAPRQPVGLAPAASRDPCRRCGVPGFRGCEHQAAYEPGPEPLHVQQRRTAF